ncbi:hypothetical protein GCM10027321_01220 [Massilia terrae]|uniref:HNH endonuclease n=1 Tax=Massilia terrae TaxID=1811224 RepID=A0ABT2CUJ5_9BURK|nr:hypothetical protein [Massilia terrae]MCS0657514.1 hypothetical protein [Massilia terrae]
MSSAPREVFWHVYIPYEVFVDVCHYMTEIGYKRTIGDLTGTVLREWPLESRRKGKAGGSQMRPITSGYQWKRLFLPEGTMLRTVFKHRSYVAQLNGDQLLYEGEAMTPTDFANMHGGARRNAWRNLWLLFPAEHEWKLADDCRSTRPSRTIRKDEDVWR